jgi:predicted DNA-binding protein (MmcQ/YjbR family)
MITENAFFKMALSFPGTEQVAHFDRLGFKVTGRRMYATYFTEERTTNIFLLPAQQKAFCKKHDEGIYPVPNKWGEKGATTFDLHLVPRETVIEALRTAYDNVLKKK